MDIGRQRELAGDVGGGVVVAAHDQAGPGEAAHLVREVQAGAEILPVVVIEVAGDDDEGHVLADGEVDDVGEGAAGAVARDVLRHAVAPRQPGERAVEMDVGGVQEAERCHVTPTRSAARPARPQRRADRRRAPPDRRARRRRCGRDRAGRYARPASRSPCAERAASGRPTSWTALRTASAIDRCAPASVPAASVSRPPASVIRLPFSTKPSPAASSPTVGMASEIRNSRAGPMAAKARRIAAGCTCRPSTMMPAAARASSSAAPTMPGAREPSCDMALNRCVKPDGTGAQRGRGLVERRVAVAEEHAHAGGGQRGDVRGCHDLGRHGQQQRGGEGRAKFGDVGVGGRREIVRIVDAAARRGDERTLHMQAADAGHALCQRVAHGLHRRAPQRRRPADECGQQRGGAEARMRGGNAAQRVGGRFVVEQHAAAAVHLQIDESRRQDDIVRQRRRRRRRAARARPPQRCGRRRASRRGVRAAHGRRTALRRRARSWRQLRQRRAQVAAVARQQRARRGRIEAVQQQHGGLDVAAGLRRAPPPPGRPRRRSGGAACAARGRAVWRWRRADRPSARHARARVCSISSVENRLSTIFCAVPAFSRVEPAIGSAPVSTRIGCAASASSVVSGLLATATVSAPRAAASCSTAQVNGVRPLAATPIATSPAPTACPATARRAASASSSAFSAASVRAALPPAISSSSRSAGQSKVGASSTASCAATRPDVPAPA